MRFRRLSAAALLAAALGTAALAGATSAALASAAPATPSGAEPAVAPTLPPDWYERGPFATLEICKARLQREAENGGINGARACHYEDRPYQWQDGYYYAVYIP
ncbi:hypothetical protein ACFYY8_29610 [Streptosporangium sp. NPDC001559]|uniref:hypothetical protein n=1 Tax=Streptosporangium sp. NPDC001559 TaxID=3366187 RepID=UPI0036EF9A2D